MILLLVPHRLLEEREKEKERVKERVKEGEVIMRDEEDTGQREGRQEKRRKKEERGVKV